MREAAANLGVSGGIGSKFDPETWMREAAANLGVSGGVACKSLLVCRRQLVQITITLG